MIKRVILAFMVFLTISFMLVALCINRMLRVNAVGDFRHNVNEKILSVQQEYIFNKPYNKDTLDYYDRLAKEIRDVPFEDMMNSFKPLTIENWYNGEQCRFLRIKTKENIEL